MFFKIHNINKNDILDNYSKISKKSNKTKDINDEFNKIMKIIFKEDKITENVMINIYTTFKIGEPAKYLLKPKTINQIIVIIILCNKHKVIFLSFFLFFWLKKKEKPL